MSVENSDFSPNEEELIRQEIDRARKHAVNKCAKNQRLDFYHSHNVLILMLDSEEFPGEKEHVLFAYLVSENTSNEKDETVRKINLEVKVANLSPASIKSALKRFLPRVFPQTLQYPIAVHETTPFVSLTNPSLAHSN